MWFYLDQSTNNVMFPTSVGPGTSSFSGKSSATSPMSISTSTVTFTQPTKNFDSGTYKTGSMSLAPSLSILKITVNSAAVLRGLASASANHTPFGIITGGVTTLTVRHGATNPLPSKGINDTGYYAGSIRNVGNLNFLIHTNVTTRSLATKKTTKTIPVGVNRFTSTFGKSSSIAPEIFILGNATALGVGQILGTVDTKIYTPADVSATRGAFLLYLHNLDTQSRTFRLFVYQNEAGPGTDATTTFPTTTIGAGQRRKIGPFYLPSEYALYGIADAANKVVAIPTGTEF
jgi:hypothetical protein